LAARTRDPISFKWIVAATVFVQNYSAKLPGIWSHTWSLAIEEHFYLSIGLLFLLLFRSRLPNPFRITLGCYVFVAIGALACRLANASAHYYGTLTHHFPTHLRIDSLCFGALLAYFYNLDPTKLQVFYRHRFATLLVSLLLILPSGPLPVQHFF